MSNINNDINSQTTSTWRMLLDETIFTNRKFYIQVAAICAAVIIFVALCNIPNMLAFAKMYFTHKYNFTYVDNMSGVFGFIAVTYFATCSAFIVSNIQDKRSRIAEFVIPASKLEKFVVRYIHLVVFIPLAALVGIAVGDVLQIILGLVITGDCQSFIVTMFRNFGFTSYSPADTFLLVALFVFFHTLLLVLGTIIRRRAWIKSNIIVWFRLFVLTMAGLKLFDKENGLPGWQGLVWAGGCAALALAASTDYNASGVIIICALYLTRADRKQQCLAGALLFLFELTASLAFVLVWFYNGQRGACSPLQKKAFYWFYPVHLLVLAAITNLLL